MKKSSKYHWLQADDALFCIYKHTVSSYKSWSERILFPMPSFLIETSIDTKIQNGCNRQTLN